MSDNSHNEIDKLFRQGSKLYDFDYNPDAWNEMEILIEKDKRKRIIVFWFVVMLIISTIGIGYYYFNLYNHNVLNPASKIEQKPFVSKLNSTDKLSNKKLLDSKNNATELITSTSEKLIDESKLNSINRNNKSQFKTNEKFTNFPVVKDHSLIANQRKSNHIQKTDKDISSQILGSNIKWKTSWLTNKISTLGYSFLLINQQDYLIMELINNTLISTSNQSINRDSHKNIFLFGLVFNEEISSLGLNKFKGIDQRYGVQFINRFRDKFSISIGVHFIRKKYEALKGEYTPPKGFWTRKIIPQSTLASCDILEIPILFGFFPKGYQNNGFYAKIGLTSYILLKERYQYFYDVPGNDLIQNWGTDNENRNWMGIGQFSFGYQHYLNGKLVFHLAPMVQIPLTGIGHGQVNLWSVGMNFSVNYLFTHR